MLGDRRGSRHKGCRTAPWQRTSPIRSITWRRKTWKPQSRCATFAEVTRRVLRTGRSLEEDHWSSEGRDLGEAERTPSTRWSIQPLESVRGRRHPASAREVGTEESSGTGRDVQGVVRRGRGRPTDSVNYMAENLEESGFRPNICRITHRRRRGTAIL